MHISENNLFAKWEQQNTTLEFDGFGDLILHP